MQHGNAIDTSKLLASALRMVNICSSLTEARTIYRAGVHHAVSASAAKHVICHCRAGLVLVTEHSRHNLQAMIYRVANIAKAGNTSGRFSRNPELN